jgi:hypothetical protein
MVYSGWILSLNDMEQTLRKIQGEISKGEADLETLVTAIGGIGSRWESIQTAFTDHLDYLNDFGEFPDLQSKIEMEQLSICDSLLAEIGRMLLLFEHTISVNRAAFARAKGSLRSKDIGAAWPYPPTNCSIGNLFSETGDSIDLAAKNLEGKRLALYRLTTETGISPESVACFVRAWPSGSDS